MLSSNTQRPEHTLPYLELPLKNKISLMREIVSSSIPSIASFLTGTLINIISVYFLSKYGDDDMVAGFGLGVVFVNALVFALIASLNHAGNILMAQSFGAQNYRACGLYFQKSLVLLGIILPPLFLALAFSSSIMKVFHIQENLADIAVIYTRIAIPAMMGNAAFDTMKAFIISQKVFYPIIYIQLSTFILHFFWAKLFIEWLHLGVEGAAICKLIQEWTAAALIYIFIKRSGHFKDTWIPWSKEAFNMENLWTQFKFSLPIAATTYIDWVYYEVMTLISGTFEAKNVVAHIAVANTSGVNFTVGMGISVTMTTYISNAIGKQSTNEAKNYFYTGIAVLGTYAASAVLLFIPSRGFWASFWSLDVDTQAYLVEVVTIFCLTSLWIDNINNGQIAFLRTIGEQKIAAVIMFTSIYIVGVPLMIIFTFLLDYKVKGLWIAFALSNFVMAVWGFSRVIKVNWTKVMADSKERLVEKGSDTSVEMNQMNKESDKTEKLLKEDMV